MKKLLFFIALLTAHVAVAQNYACLQAGVKRYFINGNGYLRGMRIDSVKAYADSVVHYPFHTPRGDYNTTFTIPLDTSGGSWLGKSVLQLNDGTFLFDNIWRDTITVKTHANVGDSWMFYNDTTSHHYLANVISWDTMTVLGMVDSVKTIRITAYDGVIPDTTDPVNNFNIVLSKDHGFSKVFDLYTFPYHKPDTVFGSGNDYFLDFVVGTVYYHHPAEFSNSIFSLVTLNNPTYCQLYNWNVGDAFEYSYCPPLSPGNCIYPYQYYYDSVVGKTTFADSVLYADTGWEATQILPHFSIVPDYNYPYDYVSRTRSLVFGNSFLIDTTLMPEEYKQANAIFYFPNDTDYCLASGKYRFENIFEGNTPFIPFEAGPTIREYKRGLGLVLYYWHNDGEPNQTTETKLLYHNKSGTVCGSYVVPRVTSVPQLLTNIYIELFPNPAAEELIIKTSKVSFNSISIVNLFGQTVSTIQTNKAQTTIDVRNIPAGVYNLCISSESGERVNRKVSIIH